MNKKKISAINILVMILFMLFVYGVSAFAFSKIADKALDRGRQLGISEMQAEAVMHGLGGWKHDKSGNFKFYWAEK
jgi:hypothetical protein